MHSAHCVPHTTQGQWFWTLSHCWDLVPCFFFFFYLLQLHPSWRESKPSCLPIVWAEVGTSLVLALHHLLALCHPAALRKFCPGYWCRGGAGTLRRFSSCGDDFDLGRSALWCVLHQVVLPQSRGCWTWHHAVESSGFCGISWIWLDKKQGLFRQITQIQS